MSKKNSSATPVKTEKTKFTIQIPDLDKRFTSYLKDEKLDIYSITHFAAIQAEELNHSKPEIVKGRKEDAAMMVIHLLIGSGFIKAHLNGDEDMYDMIQADLGRVCRLLEMYCKVAKNPNQLQRKMWQKHSPKKTGFFGLKSRGSSDEDSEDEVKKTDAKKEDEKDSKEVHKEDQVEAVSPASPETPVLIETENVEDESKKEEKKEGKKSKKSKKDDSDSDSDSEDEKKEKKEKERKKKAERKKKEEAERKKKEAEEKKEKERKKKEEKKKRDDSDSDSD